MRFLRVLVTVLTAVMIVGMIAIVALLWTRYNDQPAPVPEAITLPDGTSAVAFTQGDTWYAIVTDDDHILIYDRSTNVLLQHIMLDLSGSSHTPHSKP